MAEDEESTPGEGAEAKGKRKPLLIGAAAMALCGAVAFAAVFLMGGGEGHAESGEAHAEAEDHGDGEGKDPHGKGSHGASDVAFVPVEPLTVTVGSGAQRSHLRFTSQLEVPYGRQEEVAALMPRIVDVLGGYLRAVEPASLADRDASLRLRGQMLRRVRLVVGPDAVRDLLVTELVLN